MLLVFKMLGKVNEIKVPHFTEVQTQVGVPTAKVILLKSIETFKINSVYSSSFVFWGGVGW